MQNPRITSGSAKNKKLKTPNIINFRAVQEVAKLALFSILGDKVINAKCLDLFAGSGNLGIEALSRGAKSCDFVDKSKDSNRVVKENLKNCGFQENSKVYGQESAKFVGNTEKTYDIIFIDPFYEDTKHKFLMKLLEDALAENGLIAFFHGTDLNIEKTIEGTSLKAYTQRRFGNGYFTLLKR